MLHEIGPPGSSASLEILFQWAPHRNANRRPETPGSHRKAGASPAAAFNSFPRQGQVGFKESDGAAVLRRGVSDGIEQLQVSVNFPREGYGKVGADTVI